MLRVQSLPKYYIADPDNLHYLQINTQVSSLTLKRLLQQLLEVHEPNQVHVTRCVGVLVKFVHV